MSQTGTASGVDETTHDPEVMADVDVPAIEELAKRAFFSHDGSDASANGGGRHVVPSQAHKARLDDTERTIFFCVGYGKSGTNWLGNVLNRHPRIFCLGEFHFQLFQRALDEFTGPAHHVGSKEPYKQAAVHGVQEVIRRVMLVNAAYKPTATHLGDRSPRWFQVLLPGAPHIYIVRDGRDVAVSYTYHHLRVNNAYNKQFWPGNIQEIFEKYVARFEASEQEERKAIVQEMLSHQPWATFVIKAWGDRMRHDRDRIQWAQEADLATPVHIVRYEDLHAETDTYRAKMYEFLGLDPAQALPLSFRSGTKPGFNRGEDTKSFFRKGQTRDWVNYASDVFVETFRQHATDGLIHYGYESGEDWDASDTGA